MFASLVGFDKKFPTQGGNVIKVEFNQSDIYQDELHTFREDQQAFFFQLSRFLRSESIGTVRQLEFMIYSGDRFPVGPEYWKDVSILRTGAIVEKLVSMGVREDQLSVGVSPGEENMLKISFTIRDQETAIQNLKEADRSGLGEQSVAMPRDGF